MRRFAMATALSTLMSFGAGLTVGVAPSYAQDTIAAFYQGRQIDFYIGFSAGGGYDIYARTLARFMGDHIPGAPRIIPKNMTGAGSRVAAAYVYNIAPKNGSVLATVDQAIPLEQAIGNPGIQFDARKFNWIGNPIVDNNTLVTWRTSRVKTLADARLYEATIGATGSGGNTSSQYSQVMNTILGTKFKIILGYPGGNEINLAMENGEVEGRGSNSWASWKASKPDWVRDKMLNIIVQIGLSRARDLPDIPLLADLATNEDDRAALKLVSAPPSVGRPVFTTPDAPADRVKALRAAFDATMRDPKFLDEARRTGLDIDPVSGEELSRIVADIIDAPGPVRDRLARILAQSQ